MSQLLRSLRATRKLPLSYCRRLFANSTDDRNGGKKSELDNAKSTALGTPAPSLGTPPTLSDNRFPETEQNFVTIKGSNLARISDVLPDDADINPALRVYRYPQFFIKQDAIERSVNVLLHDVDLIKERRLTRREDEVFPAQVDIAIIGGGIMGSSIAHALKQRAPDSFSVMVIERDPQYTHASTTLSVGGIRQQFSLRENIEMSLFSVDFLRNVKRNLSVLDNEPPDLNFCPHGYLFLAGTPEGADQILVNHELQSNCGAFIDVLDTDQLKKRFPWLNTNGLILGANGVQNEGWFDPWSLLIALKAKSEFLGAQYVNGEVVDFNLQKSMASTGQVDDRGKAQEQCKYAIVRLPNGEERQLNFSKCIIATGAHSADLTRRLDIGIPDNGIRTLPLPIEPRKRYVFVFHCPDAPGLDFPLLVDPSGVYCRREGLGGNFICGKSPLFEDEPDVSNLEVDYSFFEREIWPVLANRVKAFENIKVVGAWAGYYDYNYFDQNPVIGRHPYYDNIFWATGFSGHGIQMGPAIGRAMMELILENSFETIDLSRFGWDRILTDSPVQEALIV